MYLQDDVLDFGDISHASTDGNGDDFILNSYNTDGTIDGSQLKSDAEVPAVENNASFSQQLAVAAADAFQRMSSTMSVATAPVPLQSEKKQGNEEEKEEKDDAMNGNEADAKSIGESNEGESKGDTGKDGDGLIVGWPSVEEKNQGNEKDVVANDGVITNGEDDVPATSSNDSAQFSGDATKNADDSPPSANTLADSNGQAEVEDEKDESPFNVCTDLFRF